MKTENQKHFVIMEAQKINLWLSNHYGHVYSNFHRPKASSCKAWPWRVRKILIGLTGLVNCDVFQLQWLEFFFTLFESTKKKD